MTEPIICPRCNKPAIKVRDMGPAGALYIHSYTQEKLGNQTIEAPNGCHLHRGEIDGTPRWTHEAEGIGK